jgi:hypothetical protein
MCLLPMPDATLNSEPLYLHLKHGLDSKATSSTNPNNPHPPCNLPTLIYCTIPCPIQSHSHETLPAPLLLDPPKPLLSSHSAVSPIFLSLFSYLPIPSVSCLTGLCFSLPPILSYGYHGLTISYIPFADCTMSRFVLGSLLDTSWDSLVPQPALTVGWGEVTCRDLTEALYSQVDLCLTQFTSHYIPCLLAYV